MNKGKKAFDSFFFSSSLHVSVFQFHDHACSTQLLSLFDGIVVVIIEILLDLLIPGCKAFIVAAKSY